MNKKERAGLKDGKIYNPDDGEGYQALMSIAGDGTLHVRAMCFSSLWARLKSGLASADVVAFSPVERYFKRIRFDLARPLMIDSGVMNIAGHSL